LSESRQPSAIFLERHPGERSAIDGPAASDGRGELIGSQLLRESQSCREPMREGMIAADAETESGEQTNRKILAADMRQFMRDDGPQIDSVPMLPIVGEQQDRPANAARRGRADLGRGTQIN
jgi:hypothetical protein